MEKIEYPIRVLQVVSRMDRAGLESRLMDIYRSIDRDKVQFDFYTYRDEPGFFDDEVKNLGGKVFYGDKLDLKHFTTITKNMCMFLKMHNEYKIVHCHLNQWCGIVLRGAKQAGTPVRIAHSRTALKTNSIKNAIKNIIKISTNREATDKFAVSKKAAIWLFGNRQVKKGNVIVWPNAINFQKYLFKPSVRKNVRNKLAIDDDIVIIHVGNLKPEKNHTYLLDILAAATKINSKVKLVLVGQDFMDGQIQNEAIRKGVIDQVLFLGSRSDVNDLLQAGDVFLFPSIYEGFPGAVLEAEASGLPCIISDTITEEVCLVDNVIRMSIKDNPEKWAQKALSMISDNRRSQEELLLNTGYDIRRLTEDMCEYYLMRTRQVSKI